MNSKRLFLFSEHPQRGLHYTAIVLDVTAIVQVFFCIIHMAISVRQPKLNDTLLMQVTVQALPFGACK